MFVCLYVWKYAEHPLLVWLNTDLFIIENKSLVWAEEEAEDPGRVSGMGWVFHNSGVFTGSFFPHHTSVSSAFLCFSVLCLLAIPHPLLLPHSFLFCFPSVSLSAPPSPSHLSTSLFPQLAYIYQPCCFLSIHPVFLFLSFSPISWKSWVYKKRYYFIEITN